jgi:hypothetical protein
LSFGIWILNSYIFMFNKKKKQNFYSCKIKIRNSNGGFALLYAVLITGLLVSIGMTIATIAAREVVLSSAGRESQFAFYAADTGIECALFWDIRKNKFSNFDSASEPPSPITCNNQVISPSAFKETGVEFSTDFNVDLNASNGTCATVSITKERLMAGVSKTTIRSYGRNNCVSPNKQNRVERGIVVRY